MNQSRRSQRVKWLLLGGFLAAGTLVPMMVVARGALRQMPSARLEVLWGGHGARPGKFHKPRAVAIDSQDRLYIVDKMARIQVYDRDGTYLREWQTPTWEHGKPTGLSFHPDGSLMVADTHYFRILFYAADGTLQPERTLGGEFGQGPGQFGLVTDVVVDSKGCLYVSEYGGNDRIQKFSADGSFLEQWGTCGDAPGQFARPQSMAMDEHDQLWVADACNDRIQVFDVSGGSARLLRVWGERGHELGQLRYPYNVWLADDGTVYVCEFGNHRVQQFTQQGKPIAAWGVQGRGPGQLYNPWAVVQDTRGRLHILDTYNHRVQRVRF